MNLHSETELTTSCSKKENRVLLAAAALCLRNAVGGKAMIHWPADIVLEDETVASVSCRTADNSIRLMFDIDTDRVPASAAAGTEDALRRLAEDFPSNSAELIQQYCNHCRTLMKFVDTTYRGMPVYGFAFAVDKFGGLMVMTQESRTVITIYDGKAELASDEPQQPDVPVMPRV